MNELSALTSLPSSSNAFALPSNFFSNSCKTVCSKLSSNHMKQPRTKRNQKDTVDQGIDKLAEIFEVYKHFHNSLKYMSIQRKIDFYVADEKQAKAPSVNQPHDNQRKR
eukprot:TRINITY_DN16165_c0_g1_i1.p1 TRINITY_DN16165_c0_g1~~TRINITY_DN16165_c0_g1_i1.p1  ORF type:complete len:109 (+),score=9.39 TRINITY_DN16165_c0_g1_i1:119-445(+)